MQILFRILAVRVVEELRRENLEQSRFTVNKMQATSRFPLKSQAPLFDSLVQTFYHFPSPEVQRFTACKVTRRLKI